MLNKNLSTEPFWINFLPVFIREKLKNRFNLKKIISNIGWLFFGRFLRMGVGLVVGVWVARYLGPDQYGLWNFALAFTSLFGIFAVLGLDKVAVREVVKYPEITNEILGTTFGLKLCGGIFAFIICLAVIFIMRPGEPLTIALVALSAGGFIFQAVNVVDFYFQAHVQSKYTVFAQYSAFLLISLLKVVFIFLNAPLIAFAAAGLTEVVLGVLFLVFAYAYNSQSTQNWSFNRILAVKILKDSWPLMLSGLAVMIYMRIDQVMLAQMLDNFSVGVYSAAVVLSTAWYFVPIAVANSVYPMIIKLKTSNEHLYYERMQKLLSFLVWSGICVALIITFMAEFIILKLYGQPYILAASVLTIHIWAGVFVCLGVAAGNWFMAENLQKYSLYRSLFGAVANILMNFLLIPKYGIKGAAVATLITQFMAAYCFDAFIPRTRKIFFMKTKSFFLAGCFKR